MLTIHPFQTSDRDELSRIFLKCRQDTFHWVPSDSFQLGDFDKETEGEVILVATFNTMPVGFISIWMQDHFIHHLFIDQDHQRKGLGQSLLAEGLKRIGRPARLKCLVQNSQACRFYEKNGWRIESAGHDEVMGPYRVYTLG